MSEEDDKKKAEAEAQKKKEEAEQAAAQLQEMFAANAPKNAGEGLTSGVSNILGAAVGATGIIVLAPTLGLGMGVKHGGLLGGIVGLTGGAVVGVLGGVAVALGGAVSGVTQVVRGVAATPAAITAPRQGKWWDERKGKWVSTSLPQDAKQVLENVPDDDMDILGKATAEVEEAANAEISGEAVDLYYYEVLGVGPTAEPSAIKRKYYVLARKYHPDKVGADDKEAADKFKEVSEAYQVLSDPQLRAKYDKEGRDGLSADKTEVANGGSPNLDPAILFAFLFGSDKFHDYVGRLATATSASIGDAPKISKEDAETLQVRRVTRLAVFLADKLDQYTTETADEQRAKWQAEATELAMASYGTQMVHLIGQIYTLAAELFLGSYDSQIGVVSMNKWAKSRHARIKKTSAANSNKLETLKTALEAMKLQQKAAKDLSEAKTDEEKKKLQEELETVMAETLLKIMWTTTVVDVTNTLHVTCQMVLFDQSLADKDERKRRAHALKALGLVFEECPAPEKKDGEQEANAKKLYEEAAFAAMLETIKRKEEAAAQSQ